MKKTLFSKLLLSYLAVVALSFLVSGILSSQFFSRHYLASQEKEIAEQAKPSANSFPSLLGKKYPDFTPPEKRNSDFASQPTGTILSTFSIRPPRPLGRMGREPPPEKC